MDQSLTLPPNRDIGILQLALQEMAIVYNGFSGNCAQVAMVLDEVLDTSGDYVVVSGEHYEYADHVFLRWEGLLWDMSGSFTPAEAEANWCTVEEAEDDDEPDAPAELEDFPDPDGSTIGQMADANSVLAGGFDREDFKRSLIACLLRRGFGALSEAAQDTLESPATPRPAALKPKF